jgi:soluble lytic murein transglycosylase-like protein
MGDRGSAELDARRARILTGAGPALLAAAALVGSFGASAAVAATPSGLSGPSGPVGASGSGVAPTTSTSTTSSSSSRPPQRHPASSRQSSASSPDPLAGSGATGTVTTTITTTKTTTSTTASAVPAPAPTVNPTLLPVIPGAFASAVPDFFIDTYRIPPFLLSIYQAAGMEYGVPWQVLAAINEIETDYGANQSVSSANAIGWMQFLPQTWAAYGVDVTGDGKRDPYNPADAIFAAARYLNAAGAQTNLSGAIFSYNHANWYVQSVLLRAKLIAGLPDPLVDSLTGLSRGTFPVVGRASYASGTSAASASSASSTAGAPTPGSAAASAAAKAAAAKAPTAIDIAGASGSRVVAVQDGVISSVGNSPSLGNFVVLTDDSGNRYIYAHLGSLATQVPWPKPSAYQTNAATETTLPTSAPTPSAPATAGEHAVAGQTSAAAGSTSTSSQASPARERLFANPWRPDAYAAGGRAQVQAAQHPQSIPAGQSLGHYLSATFGLRPDQVELGALRQGVRVLAGTVLGRLGTTSLRFAIRPAGSSTPQIDPRPLLDGWKLLANTAPHSASGAIASHASVGQILLAGKQQLVQTVLTDPRISLDRCTRQDAASGLLDRRVLAALEFLAVSKLSPSVSGASCGANGIVDAVDVTAINHTPVLGHQGTGSVTDLALRRLLQLQGAMKPAQIISLMKFPNAANAIALPGYANRVHIAFTGPAPASAAGSKVPNPADVLATTSALSSTLAPEQWQRLMARLEALSEPQVLAHPSSAAIADVPGSTG